MLHCRTGMTRVAFWDVDAPATLARVEQNHEDPFWLHIPEYDFIFTYGGGPAVVEDYLRLGAATAYRFTMRLIRTFIILWHPILTLSATCCL